MTRIRVLLCDEAGLEVADLTDYMIAVDLTDEGVLLVERSGGPPDGTSAGRVAVCSGCGATLGPGAHLCGPSV